MSKPLISYVDAASLNAAMLEKFDRYRREGTPGFDNEEDLKHVKSNPNWWARKATPSDREAAE